MRNNKSSKIGLDDLEVATSEHNTQYESTMRIFDEWNCLKDDSFDTICKTESLVESIKASPFKFSKELKKISEQKKTFQTCEAIKRQKQRDQMVAGVKAIAGLGVGMVTTLSFREYLNEKVGKKIGMWIVALLLILVFFIAWAFGQRKAQRNAEKEAKKAIKEIRKDSAKLKTQQAIASKNLQELRQQKKIVDEHYAILQEFAGKQFRDIPKEQQSDLIALVNDSLTLSKMLNKDVT